MCLASRDGAFCEPVASQVCAGHRGGGAVAPTLPIARISQYETSKPLCNRLNHAARVGQTADDELMVEYQLRAQIAAVRRGAGAPMGPVLAIQNGQHVAPVSR